MDTIALAGFIIGTLALSIAMMLVPVVGYVLWKYVMVPWRVMRTDMTALAAKMQILEAAQQRNQAQTGLDDNARIARIEARLAAQRRAQEMNG